MWSADALTQWKRLFARALEYTRADALIIPVIEYDGFVANVSDGQGRFREPMFIGKWFSEMNVTEEVVAKTAPTRDGYDVALGTHVTVLHMEHEPMLRRFDAYDVEPGHVFHPSDPLLERYTALRTKNSYHLYPKGAPFGDGGGQCVADTKWKKGFLRITTRKGGIDEVSRG